MPFYDIHCVKCGLEIKDYMTLFAPDKFLHLDLMQGKVCGEFVIDYNLRRGFDASVRESERAVVWAHPVHGIRYPGRNDAPMPPAYAKAGFERKELTSMSEIRRFEKASGVLSEVAHFDRGTGRSFCD